MHHPTDRITHATAFVTPVVEHWPPIYGDKKKRRTRKKKPCAPGAVKGVSSAVEGVVWGTKTGGPTSGGGPFGIHSLVYGAMGRRVDPSRWTH